MSWLRPSLAIARVTLSEILRDRVLYNVLLCAVVLLFVSILAAQLSFGRNERLLVDFGLVALNLSCTMIAVLTGAGILGKEYERRTALMALSRPISRHQFVFGKFLGLAAILALNWFLLSTLLLLVLAWATHYGDAIARLIWHPTLFGAIGLLYAQSLFLAGIAFVFSSFMATALAVVMSLGVFLVGNSVSQLRLLAGQVLSGSVKSTANGLIAALPNLEYFQIGERVSYALPVSGHYYLGAAAYALCGTLLALVATGYLLEKRES